MSDTVEITILDPDPRVVAVNPPGPITGKVGEVYLFTAQTEPLDLAVEWHATGDVVSVLVEPVGPVARVTFVAAGTVLLQATPKDVTVPPVEPPTDVDQLIIRYIEKIIATDNESWEFWQNLNPVTGNDAALSDYYSRSAAYYRFANRFEAQDGNTLATEYRKRGYWHLKTHLEGYLMPNDFKVPPRGSNVLGLYDYFTRTDDGRAREAAFGIAEINWFYAQSFMSNGGATTEGRIVARALETQLQAFKFEVVEPSKWTDRALQLVDFIHGWQKVDGKFWMTCTGQLNYMAGLLGYALMQYYRHVDPDPRCITIVEKSCRWMLDNEWWPNIDPANPVAAFRYQDFKCENGSPVVSGPVEAPTLNGLLLPMFAWPEMPSDIRAYGPLLLQSLIDDAWGWNAPNLGSQKQRTQILRTIDGIEQMEA